VYHDHLQQCAVYFDQYNSSVSFDVTKLFLSEDQLHQFRVDSDVPEISFFVITELYTGSIQPTNQPTNQPTSQLANQPTNEPTNQPTNQPANQPTNQPTNKPTNQRIF
jgi:hypothetical protein